MATNENDSFNCESKFENDEVPVSANEEDSDDEPFLGFLPSDFRLSMYTRHLHQKFRQRRMPPAMTKFDETMQNFLFNDEIVKKQLPGPTTRAMKKAKSEKGNAYIGEFVKSQLPGPTTRAMKRAKNEKYFSDMVEFVKSQLPGPTSPAMKKKIHEKDISNNGEFVKTQLSANEQDSDDETFYGFVPLDYESSIHIRDLHLQFRQRCIPPATTIEKNFSIDSEFVKIQFPVNDEDSDDKSFHGCLSHSTKPFPSILTDSRFSNNIQKVKERFCQRQNNETRTLKGCSINTVDVKNVDCPKILSSAPASSPQDKTENMTIENYPSLVTVVARRVTPALVEFLKKAEAEENLEILNFELNDCDDATETFAQQILPKLVNLKRLRLVNANEKSPLIPMLSSVSKIPTLTKLELINVTITPGFDGALAECSNLKSLLIVPTCKIKELAMVNRIVLEGIDRLCDTLKHCAWVFIKEMIANDYFQNCIPINWDINDPHKVMMTIFQFENVIAKVLPSIKMDIHQIPFREIVQEVQKIEL